MQSPHHATTFCLLLRDDHDSVMCRDIKTPRYFLDAQIFLNQIKDLNPQQAMLGLTIIMQRPHHATTFCLLRDDHDSVMCRDIKAPHYFLDAQIFLNQIMDFNPQQAKLGLTIIMQRPHHATTFCLLRDDHDSVMCRDIKAPHYVRLIRIETYSVTLLIAIRVLRNL